MAVLQMNVIVKGSYRGHPGLDSYCETNSDLSRGFYKSRKLVSAAYRIYKVDRSCLDRQKTTFKHIRCPLLQRS
jgi:hypothetical protein